MRSSNTYLPPAPLCIQLRTNDLPMNVSQDLNQNVVVLTKAHDVETGVPHEYEARFRIPGTSQITPAPRYNGDLHHPLHRGVLPARAKHGASPLFGGRKGLQTESALEIEKLMCASDGRDCKFRHPTA
jgi:hypothetical protein